MFLYAPVPRCFYDRANTVVVKTLDVFLDG
jgi:hypothetical protein